MRILLGITVAAALVVAAWANIPNVAKQHDTVSIDPATLAATRANLPTEQYDAF
jgi:hypothetical protein